MRSTADNRHDFLGKGRLQEFYLRQQEKSSCAAKIPPENVDVFSRLKRYVVEE